MNNIIKMFSLLCLWVMANIQVSAKTTTSAYQQYEPECLGVELDGSQTLRVWGVGSNKKDAVEQAKKDAVRAVIFKGIPTSDIFLFLNLTSNVSLLYLVPLQTSQGT